MVPVRALPLPPLGGKGVRADAEVDEAGRADVAAEAAAPPEAAVAKL